MAKKVFSIKIGPGEDRLIGSGDDRKVVRLREIVVYENSKVIKKFEAADNDADIEEQIRKRGYIVDSRAGDTWTAHERPMTGGERSLVGCFVVVALVILLGFVGCMSLVNGDGKRDSVGERDAIYACHDFVKDKLKSPSTAKFSNDSASGSGSSWTASGSVDSQNSFGAMVRTQFSCTLTYTSSNETWRGTARLAE